jgi:diguanylate cyclase (GGDEF)-like protein/PAS domain S-box-containing protein
MRGPAVNLVLLALLVIFVGIQQRFHSLTRSRLWFAGWACVLVSVILWEFNLPNPALDGLREAARFDFILLAQLLFVISFLVEAPQLRRVVLLGSMIGVPAVVIFNIHEIFGTLMVPVIVVVVLWQIYGVIGMQRLLPSRWPIRRLLILCLCIGYGAVFVVHLIKSSNPDLQDWVMAELALSSAVMYGADDRRRSLASVLGTLGFLAWAAFYLIDAGVTLTLLSGWRHSIAVFWDLPKFLVAFSMVLQVSEEARGEKEEMADRYQQLYQDFRLVFERSPHPMWIYNETTLRILSANGAAQQVYGYTEPELQAMDIDQLLAHPDPEPGAHDPSAALAPPAQAVLGEPIRLRHRLKDQGTIAVDVTEHRILFQGEAARFVTAVDVTEVERQSRELQHRANHDALTGLPNRRQLEDCIEQCLARSMRDHRKAVLLTIDVDHFKQVNDTYGHIVGDECLQAVAARLQSRIRQVDTLARTGGEEFAAIIGGLSHSEDAHKIAATLLKVFDDPLLVSVGELHIKISIGGAVFPDDGTDPETLRRRSDEALYAAKHQGRNRAVFAPHGAPARDRELSASQLATPAHISSAPSAF